jgi:hypothetical protein
MTTRFNPRRGTIVGEARIAGREEGINVGIGKGVVKGKAQRLLHLLERREFPLTEEIRQRVTTCTDEPLQDLWFDRAIDAATLDEIFADPSTTDRVPAPAQSPEQSAASGPAPANPGSSVS